MWSKCLMDWLTDWLLVLTTDDDAVNGVKRRHGQSGERGQRGGRSQDQGPTVGQCANDRACWRQQSTAEGREWIQWPLRQISARQGKVQEQSKILSASRFVQRCGWLLWKLNQTQPTKIYLDVSVSIRGLRQKKMKLILLPVLAIKSGDNGPSVRLTNKIIPY